MPLTSGENTSAFYCFYETEVVYSTFGFSHYEDLRYVCGIDGKKKKKKKKGEADDDTKTRR